MSPPSPFATTTTAPAPTAAGVSAALAPLLDDARLGGRVLAQVRDAQSGSVLLDRDAATPAAPASTAKLVTAAAVLSVRAPDGPDHHAGRGWCGAGHGRARRRRGSRRLPRPPDGTAPAYPEAARISDLARAVRAAGITPVGVVVDASLFTGVAGRAGLG